MPSPVYLRERIQGGIGMAHPGITIKTRESHQVSLPSELRSHLGSRLGDKEDWPGPRYGASLGNVGEKEAIG